METENTEWETLVLKKISQGLSPSEEALLEKHIRENPEKEKEVQEFTEVWTRTGGLPIRKGLSRNERWAKLRQHIQKEEIPARRLSIPLWTKVAAALTILAVALGAYFVAKPTLVSVTTAYGETKSITLPDQSIVTLNAGTTIQYDPSSWEDERSIQLTGEAYFEVTKLNVPFRVHSGNTRVQVLGTTFNVRTRLHTTDVTCLTGKVRVSQSADDVNHVVLTKGNHVTVGPSGISEVTTVDGPDAIQWTTGGLSFKDTPLVEVFAELERHFNTKIIVSQHTTGKIITAKFSQPQLESTLKAVCLSAGLTYRVNPDATITIE